MIVLPADHIIQNVKRFHEVLQHGVQAAGREGALVTIGIEPSFPATGYGYIQFEGAVDHETDDVKVYPVKTFAEKPDIETACRFIDSGDFLWNSGMFIWQVDSVLDAIGEHLPDVAEAFSTMEENIDTKNETSAIRHAYEDCPNISIDYGAIERPVNVFVLLGDLDCTDFGTGQAR